jgi:phage baseplate assembly protein V
MSKTPVFETGIVTVVDDAAARARVKIPSRGGVESYWLEVLQRGSKGDRDYWMPTVGDQVRILADERLENGCILGAIYSEADPPPVSDRQKVHVTFSNGSVIEFDKTTGILKLDLTKVEIICSEESTINGKAIAVIGAGDDDSEGNGADKIVSSGQL